MNRIVLVPRTVGFISLLLGLALAVGCSRDPNPPEASDMTASPEADMSEEMECPGGAGCVCNDQFPCAGDLSCQEGVCAVCQPGASGCACQAQDVCEEGLLCAEGLCQACPVGEIGCACDGTRCDSGAICDQNVCSACEPGTMGCACDAGTCSSGLTCTDDMCVMSECEPGQPGCMCLDGDVCTPGARCRAGVCDPCARPGGVDLGGVGCGCDAQTPCLESLECSDAGVCRECIGKQGCSCDDQTPCEDGLSCSSDKTCQPCEPGTLGCVCDEDDACGDELICSEDECKSCAPDFIGSPGCPCASGMTCDGGLACQQGTCAACPLGTTGCPCDMGICQEGNLCGVSNVCEACVPGTPGCVCDAGACGAGVCDDSTNTCRAPRECGQDVTCAMNQKCSPATGTQDAECLPECEPGWVWDVATGACKMGSATCSNDPNDPNSILQMCEGLHRECVEDMDGAMCTGCSTGFEDDAGTCVPVTTCAQLGCVLRECAAATANASATCEPCAAGRVEVSATECRVMNCMDLDCPFVGKVCVPESGSQSAYCEELSTTCAVGVQAECVVDINASPVVPKAGLTGAFGSLKNNLGNCVCATASNFFLNSSYQPEPCDADRDGFVREEAFDALSNRNNLLQDVVLRANARCTLRSIIEVELRHELGGTLADPDPLKRAKVVSAMDVFGVASLPLYESKANDESALGYGTGRTMTARERNSFTKACVEAGSLGTSADFNDNDIEDAREWHGSSLVNPRSLAPELGEHYTNYTKVAYFLELYEGWFERTGSYTPDLEEEGRWVIRERRRDGTSTNNEAQIALGYDQGTYWQQCRRRPDALVSDSRVSHRIGLDFSEFPAEEGGWRGMLHSSQFKCVEVIEQSDYDNSSGADPGLQRPYLVTTQILNATGIMLPAAPVGNTDIVMPGELNVCALGSAAVSTRTGTDNALDPSFTCTRATGVGLSSGVVGFVAVNYMNYSTKEDYLRGCVDECREATQLCQDAGTGALGEGSGAQVLCGSDPAEFGKSVAVCGGHVGSHSVVTPNVGRGSYNDVGGQQVLVDGHVPVLPNLAAGQASSGGDWTVSSAPVCCMYCGDGVKPCGDECIPDDNTCVLVAPLEPGCACEGVEGNVPTTGVPVP